MKPILVAIILSLAAACSSAPEPTAVVPVETTGEATPTPETVAQAVIEATITSAPVIATAQPFSAAGEPLVARVNQTEITQAQFRRALERAQQQIPAADMAALEASVLDNLIEQVLIEQAAAAQNIVISDAQIDEEYQFNRSLAQSDEQWQQWLADNLYTEAEFRDSLYSALIAGLVRDTITNSLPQNVLQVRARHILVETEAEAQQVLQRLQNGEDFAAIAAGVSKDVTTRDQGGDLGWFIDGELLQPGLSQAAFSLEPGQIAGPLVTTLGYHIIQTLERAEQPLPEEKRPLQAQIAFLRWLQGQTYNAIIERYPAQ